MTSEIDYDAISVINSPMTHFDGSDDRTSGGLGSGQDWTVRVKWLIAKPDEGCGDFCGVGFGEG